MDKQQLKNAGLKATTPRLKILEFLEVAKPRHVSADEISLQLKNAGESIGLATLYRVLSQFEAAGLVIKHNFEEGCSVYEINEGEHHDHLVCSKCRKVIEFCDEVIEERQREIAKQHGFTIEDHSLNIYGFCSECA